MGTAHTPLPVMLFMGIMVRERTLLDGLLAQLRKRWGPVAFSCGPVPFRWSRYYDAEMGEGIRKWYGVFSPLIDREMLPEIKHETNDIESRLSCGGRRRVNLDPGYLGRDKLVLASTKDFFHRLYLRSGIFGEVTLSWQKGSWRHFSWTYADYRDETVRMMLTKARARLAGRLRKTGAKGISSE